MLKKSMLLAVYVLILSSTIASAFYEKDAATIKNGLETKGLPSQVVYVNNSSYGIPAFVVVVNVSDGDYLTAARRAMIAAASVVASYKWPTCAVIGLIGPLEKAYQFKINNVQMPDINYEVLVGDLDASKKRAEVYFDSAVVTTPQELDAYFKT